MADLVIDSLRGASRREQLAWAAGLFEGEGSFTFAKRGKYVSIVAELGMTDADRVELFHSIIGVGNVTKHSKPLKDYWKPVSIWKVASFEGTQHTIATLWFWLGPRRRNRAQEILKLYHDGVNIRRLTFAKQSEVDEAKRLLTSGVSIRKAAKILGRSGGFVSHIKQGRTHKGEADHARFSNR